MTCAGTKLCQCERCLRLVHAAEVAELRLLIRELASALNLMGDHIDDPAFNDLLARARSAGAP